MNKKEKALDFAKKAHEGQMRKGKNIPMITHPIKVAETLEKAGFNKEVVMAAYLHDVVEDTPVTMEEIKEEFGENVARIVAGNTEDKTKSWEARKQHTIDWIKEAPLEVKALIVADKLSNFSSLVEDYEEMGDEVWNLFKRGKEKQQWYFESIAQNMLEGLSTKEVPDFFYTYKEKVEKFFHKK